MQFALSKRKNSLVLKLKKSKIVSKFAKSLLNACRLKFFHIDINDNKDNKVLGGNENLYVYLLLNFVFKKNTFFCKVQKI